VAEAQKSPDKKYFLGFDGGGTKTECVLADGEGRILARAASGPSNPLRSGYARAWFALGEAADVVLRGEKLTTRDISGVCAGIGGAGRAGVGHRLETFFRGMFSHAEIQVKTDLDIAFAAAFKEGEGILLLGGTGSAALGRTKDGKSSRVGGRGPWFSDEGSAYDIGRQAFRAVVLADEHRGPQTALSRRIVSWHKFTEWDTLYDQIIKNADAVFPKTFPLVAQLADKGDEVSQELLRGAAISLARLASSVAKQLDWNAENIRVALVGGLFGKSQYLDGAIESELRRSLPGVSFVAVNISPAEAAVRIAMHSLTLAGQRA